jgi:hypothetical protein
MDAHRAARLADQARVRFLLSEVAWALLTLAVLAAAVMA